MPRTLRVVTAGVAMLSVIAVAQAAPGETELVSPRFGPSTPYDSVIEPAVSVDGRFVSFCVGVTGSWAPNDTNDASDCVVRDRVAQKTVNATVSSAEVQGNSASWFGKLNADGRYLVFASFASNLVPRDTNGAEDVFVRDLTTGLTERVSVRSDGSQIPFGRFPSMSADGRMIAFNTGDQLAVRDRLTQQTRFLNVGRPGYPLISPDGGYIAVRSYSQLKVIDLATGQRDRIDRNSDEVAANSPYSTLKAISRGGRFVLFTSDATNLAPGDNNGYEDLFLRDRLLGTTERVNVRADGTEFLGDILDASMSHGGRFIAFAAWGGRVRDHIVLHDIFLRDRRTGSLTRVNRNSNGVFANGTSVYPALSPDGRFIAFTSDATNLSPDDQVFGSDVYVRQLR